MTSDAVVLCLEHEGYSVTINKKHGYQSSGKVNFVSKKITSTFQVKNGCYQQKRGAGPSGVPILVSANETLDPRRMLCFPWLQQK